MGAKQFYKAGTLALILLTGGHSPAFAACNLAPTAVCDGVPCPGLALQAGAVVYNNDYDVLQVCRNDGTWMALSDIPPGPPSGCPSIGDVCNDGSVYAGISPDGNVPMYTTPDDTIGGDAPWNDGGSAYTTTGATDLSSGSTNTPTIVVADANSSLGGQQQHTAAQRCHDLSDHGRNDWYLPSRDELYVLRANRVAIGGFSGNYYWSSTEVAGFNDLVASMRFSDGYGEDRSKYFNYPIRCVRK